MVQYVKERIIIVQSYRKALTSQQNSPATDPT